jgi:hypothetical protein
MTQSCNEEMFRQAAEGEGGMPVSAGARVAQVRMAVDSGHALLVDLSAVPEDKRPMIVAGIKELVNRASTRQPTKGLQPAPNASNQPS